MNQLTVRPYRLARLRKLCLALPQTSEKIAWGDPTWRVRDRIFAMQKGNVAGHRPSLWLKDRRPSAILRATLCRQEWVVGVWLDTRSLDWSMLAHLIEESHGLIAPKAKRRSRGE